MNSGKVLFFFCKKSIFSIFTFQQKVIICVFEKNNCIIYTKNNFEKEILSFSKLFFVILKVNNK